MYVANLQRGQYECPHREMVKNGIITGRRQQVPTDLLMLSQDASCRSNLIYLSVHRRTEHQIPSTSDGSIDESGDGLFGASASNGTYSNKLTKAQFAMLSN